MNLKKILAGVAASALAVSAMSVCALASEPVKKPESYEKPPMLIGADTILPDTIYGAGVEVTFNLTVNDVGGGWANGSAGIIVDGEILQDEGATVKFGGKECDAASNRSWFPEGSVVIEEGQKTATVVCKADLTGKSGFNIYIFSGQPTDAADNGFFTLDSVTIKNEAGFEATYADGALTIAGGESTGASAVDIADYFEGSNEGATLYLVADDGKPQWAVDAGVDITTIYGVRFYATFDAAEIADETAWIGGGIGANSNSTGWKSIEWGRNSKAITADIENGTITWMNDAPIFQADDAYAHLWIQDWASKKTSYDKVEVLDKDGNVIIGEAPAEEAETTTEAPEVTEATEATEAATEAPEATEATEATTEAVASSEAVTDAPEGNTSAGTSDKNNADTGVEGVAIVAALAVLAGGAVVIAKKRK